MCYENIYETFCIYAVYTKKGYILHLKIFNEVQIFDMLMCFLQLFNEVDQIHPSTSSFCARFRDCFTAVLPNVLKLAKGQSHLTKHYTDARQDALAEDLPGSNSHISSEPDNTLVVFLLL